MKHWVGCMPILPHNIVDCCFEGYTKFVRKEWNQTIYVVALAASLYSALMEEQVMVSCFLVEQ